MLKPCTGSCAMGPLSEDPSGTHAHLGRAFATVQMLEGHGRTRQHAPAERIFDSVGMTVFHQKHPQPLRVAPLYALSRAAYRRKSKLCENTEPQHTSDRGTKALLPRE